MGQKSLLSKRQKQYISKIVIAVFLALFIIAGALLMAGGLLRVLGAGKTRDQIRVVDTTTEKTAVIPDQKIQAQMEKEQASEADNAQPSEEGSESEQDQEDPVLSETFEFAVEDENTVAASGKYTSKAMILIDLESGKIIAQKKPENKVLPTALTKTMAALVAIENLTAEQLDQTLVMTEEAKTFCKENGQSKTDIEVGAEVTVRDLLYGTIVPAGADACYELANMVAGSQEAFTELMNEKAKELGLSATTVFTNPAGVNESGHTSTVKDLAIIMKAACDNPELRPVMESRTYSFRTSGEAAEKVSFNSKIYKKLESCEVPGTIVAAKSGYTSASGAGCMTVYEAPSGKRYICVTAGAESADDCAYEQVTFLKKYTE